jgi:hypothetical protein
MVGWNRAYFSIDCGLKECLGGMVLADVAPLRWKVAFRQCFYTNDYFKLYEPHVIPSGKTCRLSPNGRQFEMRMRITRQRMAPKMRLGGKS